MLDKLTIQNFTAFAEAEFDFAEGLNVIVGENGTGKSYLLKLGYAQIAKGVDRNRGPNSLPPTKSVLQKRYASKLRAVMRPDALGRLVRRRQGNANCRIRARFGDAKLNTETSFSAGSKTEVKVDTLPKKWHTNSPAFFPTRELMTIYPGFVSMYESRFLEFEETYRDTCLLLGAPMLRDRRQPETRTLLDPLEEIMGGTVVLKGGRFYLKIPGRGMVEMPSAAEGIRKLAMVAQLVATGFLQDKGYLFWDEPETNLNPKLIKRIAETIWLLCRNGIQVFVATHSLFLLQELEILSHKKEFAAIERRFFALAKPEDESEVLVEQADIIGGLDTLVMLDEELRQSDRYLAMDEELRQSYHRTAMTGESRQPERYLKVGEGRKQPGGHTATEVE